MTRSSLRGFLTCTPAATLLLSDRGLLRAERNAVRGRSKREDAILSSGYHLNEMPWLLESIRATVFAPDIRAVGLPNWESLVKRAAVQTQNNREVEGAVEAGP